MASKTPKLPLDAEEKECLRKARIKLSEVHMMSVHELASLLKTSVSRAETIKALALFQQIPSIGMALAENLVYHLDIISLEQIEKYNGAFLFDALEQVHQEAIDPCVEDQLRCVVHYASNPDSTKTWPDFTNERKQFRLLTVIQRIGRRKRSRYPNKRRGKMPLLFYAEITIDYLEKEDLKNVPWDHTCSDRFVYRGKSIVGWLKMVVRVKKS